MSPREAEPIALRFNAAGYHAFILRYSVAASLGVLWDKPVALGGPGIEPGMNRPDALILSYPVITTGPFARRGSIENLLGPGAGPAPLENSLLFAGAESPCLVLDVSLPGVARRAVR